MVPITETLSAARCARRDGSRAACSGGSGARPRMWSAAFSPTMIEGALRLPLVICGKIELSATRSPSTPITRHSGSTTAPGIVRAPHPAGAAGVIGAFGVLADEGVELGVGLHLRPRLDLVADVGREGVLREDLARQADAGAEVLPVLLVAHVVEADPRRVGRDRRERSVTWPREGDRIGPTWAWKPCPSAAALPS